MGNKMFKRWQLTPICGATRIKIRIPPFLQIFKKKTDLWWSILSQKQKYPTYSAIKNWE